MWSGIEQGRRGSKFYVRNNLFDPRGRIEGMISEGTSTHHSAGETLSEVNEADLRQASTVVAITSYLAAIEDRLWR